MRRQLVASAGGLRPLARPPNDRIRYHLSAVLTVASAGVAASVAERLVGDTGASPREAKSAVAAILRSVAANLEAGLALDALTGPFVRGDLARIQSQLAALSGDPIGRDLYSAIGIASASIAPALSESQRSEVLALLGA